MAGAVSVGSDTDIDLILTPAHPGAQTAVEARVESYTFDLSRSQVRWIENGVIEEEGTGKTVFSFTTGALGTPTKLLISARSFEGQIFTKELTVIPASIALMWQSNSYTPPFYKGKALFSIQGTGEVVAMPSFVREDGTTVGAKELVYRWKEGEEGTGTASGYGKDSLAVMGRIPIRPIVVSVEAATLDNSLIATGEVVIPPVSPKIVFYEEKPLSGRSLRNALGSTFTVEGDEMRVSAVPYFFDTPARIGALSYSWSVNGTPSTERGPDLSLRRSGTEGGRANLSLTITSPVSIFQAAEAVVSLLISQSSFGAP